MTRMEPAADRVDNRCPVLPGREQHVHRQRHAMLSPVNRFRQTGIFRTANLLTAGDAGRRSALRRHESAEQYEYGDLRDFR